MSEHTTSKRTPGLQFVWWQTRPEDEAGTWWGQLAGSTHRLRVVADQLELLERDPNIEAALMQLGYHLENYFMRIYELRERVLGYLMAITKDSERVRALKNKQARQAVLTVLRERVPKTIEPLQQLLKLLDEEIKIRNTHTHKQFLNIVLDTGQDIFDPRDALVDLENDPSAWSQLEEFLRMEIRRLSELYAEKVRAIYEVTWRFLDVAEH